MTTNQEVTGSIPVGRGTRLCPDLLSLREDKKEFLVFDYCQNFEFFETNPDGYDTKAQESVKQKIFKRRLELVAALDAQEQDKELSADLKDQMHGVVSSMNLDNFIVRWSSLVFVDGLVKSF